MRPVNIDVYVPPHVKTKYQQFCSEQGERSVSARILRLIHKDMRESGQPGAIPTSTATRQAATSNN